MPDKRAVFISYSRANTDFARALYAKLQALGFTLWRDRSDMEGSHDWWRQIQMAIENVDTMLLVLSPKALESAVVAQPHVGHIVHGQGAPQSLRSVALMDRSSF